MVKLKPLFTGMLFFAGATGLMAQNGPVTTGGDASGSGGSVSYSVGQIDYIAPTGAGGNTNEGLQQPYEIFTFGIDDASISLEVSIYPNPTASSVFLKIGKDDLSGLLFQLFDNNGKEILNRNISNQITEIDLETFTSGTYILQVVQSQKPIQSFKIIKK
jgi:hypothetical protein